MPVMAGKAKDYSCKASFTGPHHLRDAMAAVGNFADQCGLPQKSGVRLAVIVEELVSNLCEHGNLSESQELELALNLADNVLTMELTDPCPPFDPRTHEFHGPDMDRGGGVGLGLVREWANIDGYYSNGGKNRLVIAMAV